MAAPRSPTRAPGFASETARPSAARVTPRSRSASLEARPTATVRAESAYQPQSTTPKSSPTTSPSFSTRKGEGIRWMISSFTEMQTQAGNPR